MIFQTHIETRYPDADQMGIVHHAVYPLWYEIARMNVFSEIGFPFTEMRALGINPAMVNLNMQYSAPAYYPDKLIVKSFIKSFAPKKLELSYAIYRMDDGSQISSAISFHIWTGPDMKSISIEKTLPNVYEKIRNSAEKSLEF